MKKENYIAAVLRVVNSEGELIGRNNFTPPSTMQERQHIFLHQV